MDFIGTPSQGDLTDGLTIGRTLSHLLSHSIHTVALKAVGASVIFYHHFTDEETDQPSFSNSPKVTTNKLQSVAQVLRLQSQALFPSPHQLSKF